MKLLNNLLDIIMPSRCVYCRVELGAENFVCEDCLARIKFIEGPVCKRCGAALKHEWSICLNCEFIGMGERLYYDSIRAVHEYCDFSKTIILKFKYGDNTLYARFFAELIYKKIISHIKNDVDYLMPIPIHWTRLLSRKYNQAALILRRVYKMDSELKILWNTLRRIKRTKYQSGNIKKRITNVRDVFRVAPNRNELIGKRILLLDDVFTTGATVNECARILKEYGVKSVVVACLARVNFKSRKDFERIKDY